MERKLGPGKLAKENVLSGFYQNMYVINYLGINESSLVKKIIYTVAKGWRPGAVSKCLLRKLNEAKRRTSAVESRTPSRRTKKKFEDKPTLIVSKRQGQYSVEMQATPDQESYDQYRPLVYKIASAANEKKIKRRERKQRRLIRNIDKQWSDPYHPELCDQVCLRAYKEAICRFDDIPEYKEAEEESLGTCSCEDDGSSDTDSLDVDWEIHFTPPVVRYNAQNKKPLPEPIPTS